MKFVFTALLLTSFSIQASPLISMKDRLRLHLWVNGLEDKAVKKKSDHKLLPEEIERPLRKI